MKRFNLFTIAVLALFAMCSVALADSTYDSTHSYTTIFSAKAASATTALVSAAVRMGKNTRADIIFHGYSTTTAGVATSVVTMNNGTAILQCAPTSSGPFVPMKDKLNTAISTAADGLFQIDTTCMWVRASWTPARIGLYQFLNVYLLTVD